jgi:hypothetical protein
MAQSCHGPPSLGLSRGEAWVLHAAVVRRIEREREAGREPTELETLRERIESCGSLEPVHLAAAERALDTYADDAPERDEAKARAVLNYVRMSRSTTS